MSEVPSVPDPAPSAGLRARADATPPGAVAGGPPIRIAMWSGPRNISTALMRSWEARGDCAVVDEPFYAHYLQETGLDHPGRAEVLAAQPRDWRVVVASLTGPVAGGRPIQYQKQMAHHLLPMIDRGWLMDELPDGSHVVSCFLVRDPAAMLVSLGRVLDRPLLEDTGLPQQVELFDRIRERTGIAPPVIDARDVLDDPAGTLSALCRRLGVPWTERMLSWPAGRRETDGVWAPYWYEAVERSTGFERRDPRGEPVPPALERLLGTCRDFHDVLAEHAIRPRASMPAAAEGSLDAAASE